MNNTTRENIEEGVEENKKKEKSNYSLKELQKRFISERVKDKWIDFSENFWDNFAEIYEDFLNFLRARDDWAELVLNGKFEESETRDEMRKQLKMRVFEDLLPAKKSFEALFKTYNDEYNFEDSKKNDLENILKKTSIFELKKLVNSEKKREGFLLSNKIYKNKQEAQDNRDPRKDQNIDGYLKELNINEKNLDEEGKKVLINIVWIFKWDFLWTIYAEDFIKISNKLDKKSKINLIKLLIQNLSYKEIVDLWILDKNIVEAKIIKEIKKFSEESFGEEIDDRQALNIFNNLEDLNNFNINVNIWELWDSTILDSFFNQTSVVSKYDWTIFEKWTLKEDIAKKITNEINNNVAEEKEELYGKWHLLYQMNLINCDWDACELDKTDNFHKSFIEFIKWPDSWISQKIKDNIDKLQAWNYISLKPKGAWTLSDDASYFKINTTDKWDSLEEKKLVFEDITTIWWIKKTSYDVSKKDYVQKNYNAFWNNLKALSDNNTNSTIEFLSQNEFDLLDLEEVEESDEITTAGSLVEKISKEIFNKEPEFKAKQPIWFSILQEDWDGKWWDMVFDIVNFDDNNHQITVKWWVAAPTTLTYNELYELFRERKNKFSFRKKINSWKEFLDDASSIKWEFKNLEIWDKNNLVWKKSTDEEGKKYNFLRNNNTWKWIYIEELDNWEVSYKFWKYTAEWEFKDIIYSTSGFTKLLADIKKYNLIPSINLEEAVIAQNKKIEEEEESDEKPAYKKSWLKSFVWRVSFSEIWGAFMMFPDVIKNNLERWNKLTSARLAMQMWRGLWKWVYYELKSQFASEENKIIDELSNQWKDLWTNELLEIIEDIMLTTNSPRYEVDAAMITLLEKYWSLYPKRLEKYRWSLIWYKKFWGSKWDTKYTEIQKKSLNSVAPWSWEDQPVPFTEEVLLEDHLKALDKDDKQPFAVRPRADKAFWKAKKKGIADGEETWKDKSSGMPTAAERINYTLGLIPWEEAEFMGWMENIFWKHGPAVEMHMVPFILTASWLAKDFDPIIIQKLKGMAYTNIYPYLALNSSESGIKTYQNFIIESTKVKFWDNSVEYEAIKDAIWEKWKEDRVKALRDFWNNYWNDLVETLNWNDWKNFAKINDDWNNDEEWKTKINNYLDSFWWIVSDTADYWPKDDDIIAELSKNAWIYTYTGSKVILGKITADSGWNFRNWISKTVYFTYIDYLKNIKNYDIDEDRKKDLFKKVFSDLEKQVRWGLAANINRFRENPTSDEIKNVPLLSSLVDENLIIYWNKFWKWNDYDHFLNDSWENFNNWWVIWWNSVETWEKVEQWNVIDKTKEGVDNTIQWKYNNRATLDNIALNNITQHDFWDSWQNINKKTEEILDAA